MLKIDEAVKAEIETATGRPVPDPQSRRFEAFFESLTHDHPDLARKLEDALEVTTTYPDEEAQRAALRRARIDGLVRRMFTREVWGQRVLDRRRISFVVFFVVFGVVAAGWSVTLLRGRSGQTVQSAAHVVAEEVQPVPVAMEIDPEPALVAQVASPLPPRNEGGGSSSLPVRELPPYPGSVPPAPTEAHVPPGNYSADASSANMVASLPLGDVRAVDAPALAFSTEAVGSVGESLEFRLPLEVASPASALTDGVDGNDRTLAPALVTSGVENGNRRAQAPVVATTQPADIRFAAAFLQFPAASAAIPTAISEEEIADRLLSPSESLEASPQIADTAAAPVQVASPPLNLPAFASDSEAPRLPRPGTLVKSTLTRDLVIAEGETKQVIADSAEGWCKQEACLLLRWVGTATLLESGRVDARFSRAYIDGRSIEIEGVAFGSDGAEGLPAHLADVTPSLLADLLRAGAGGVAGYVDAATRRQTITLGNGTVITEAELPSFLNFVLGHTVGVARLPEEHTSVIRLAAVEAGADIEILLR